MNTLPSAITLCEVGLRDGLQNEKTILPTQEKIDLLHGLVDAGFKVIEVGSFMHPKAVPQMADTDEVFKAVGQIPGVELRALIPRPGARQHQQPAAQQFKRQRHRQTPPARYPARHARPGTPHG